MLAQCVKHLPKEQVHTSSPPTHRTSMKDISLQGGSYNVALTLSQGDSRG